MIITGDEVAAFVGRQVLAPIVPPFTTLGIVKDGQVVAGVVFNHFTGSDCHVTIAGHGWDRGFLAEVGNYVFQQLGCVRMTAVTEKPRIVRIAERLGGQVEGLMRNHFGEGRDAFLVGILRDEYKF